MDRQRSQARLKRCGKSAPACGAIHTASLAELAPKIYEAIGSMDALRARANQLLDLYNNKYSSKKMPLVLFDDALKHLTRISRAI